jgi:hypothetical protein
MTKTLENASQAEAAAARKLVKLALSRGFFVSVNDGEEWTVKYSNKATEILAALDTTGQDYLTFRDADKNKLGTMFLVWGNSAPELIADYSANDAMESLWNEWHAGL